MEGTQANLECDRVYVHLRGTKKLFAIHLAVAHAANNWVGGGGLLGIGGEQLMAKIQDVSISLFFHLVIHRDNPDPCCYKQPTSARSLTAHTKCRQCSLPIILSTHH